MVEESDEEDANHDQELNLHLKMPLKQQRKTISQSEIIVDDKKPLQEEQFSDDISDEDNDIDEVFQDAYDFIPSSSIKMPSEFRDKSIALRSLR